MPTTVHGRDIGPITLAEANYLRDLQKCPNYTWGYTPELYRRENGWYVTMFGERDANIAYDLLRKRKKLDNTSA